MALFAQMITGITATSKFVVELHSISNHIVVELHSISNHIVVELHSISNHGISVIVACSLLALDSLHTLQNQRDLYPAASTQTGKNRTQCRWQELVIA